MLPAQAIVNGHAASGATNNTGVDGCGDGLPVRPDPPQQQTADVKEAADKARLAVIKPMEEELPKIEEKIKGLSGESATEAKEKLAAFKKSLEQFKSAAPDKWESLKDGLLKQFEELKKLVGLAK